MATAIARRLGDGRARATEGVAQDSRRSLEPCARYLLRRVLLSIPVLLGVVVVTFLLLRLIPGDPVVFILGPHASHAQIPALRRQLGLDEPIWTQFWRYLDGLLHGRLGTSIYYQHPSPPSSASVSPSRLRSWSSRPFSPVVITVPLAAHAATHQDQVSDHGIRLFSLVGLGMPSFWLGIILIIFFGVDLHWFPVGGYGTGFGSTSTRSCCPGSAPPSPSSPC